MVLEGVTGEQLKLLFEGGLAFLADHQQEIDRLNVFPVPDGDTGRNMYLTMQAAVRELKQANTSSLSGICEALAKGSLMGARGNSGIILSQLVRGFADGVRGDDELSLTQFAKAWQSAVTTAYHAVMTPVEGTMLTVARGFSQGINDAAKTESNLKELLLLAIKKGNETLRLTPELLPVLKKAGVVDAGGKGLMVFLEGGLQALGNGSYSPLTVTPQEPAEQFPIQDDDEEDFDYTYCVEFLVQGDPHCVKMLRNTLQGYGGSLIVGQIDDMIKVHVHSNHPGQVLEYCLQRGTLHNIHINNMRDQWKQSHGGAAQSLDHDEAKSAPGEVLTPDLPANPQEIGVLAVAAGEGIKDIFKSLGAMQLIEGGQTMNPPVEEFVRAIESIPNQQVLILPNNKNLIMAAEQAKKLVSRRVSVLPTTSVQAGISALLAFNASLDMAANTEKMEQAAGQIKAAEVTYAVRDAILKDQEIKQGDLIGLWQDDIVTVGQSLDQVVLALVDQMLGEQDELVTLLAGNGVTPEETDRIASLIRRNHPQIELEVHEGGQPVYYFLISIE
ncbi:MAG: DAK2 domain-containing protein [Thermacetogeniaceae bacterium]